jgi:hypothetical protein
VCTGLDVGTAAGLGFAAGALAALPFVEVVESIVCAVFIGAPQAGGSRGFLTPLASSGDPSVGHRYATFP